MVKEGYYFGVPPFLLGILAIALHWPILGALLIAFGLFCFSFFRDPDRAIPDDPGAIVSPADGRVVVITDEPNAGRPGTRISIFLNVFDVHVNRAPITGKIIHYRYNPGKKLAAMVEKSSTENEQNLIVMQDARGGTLAFKQIAGLLARRIVFDKKEGDEVGRGERVGMIKFGSRVDIFFPANAKIRVAMRDKVKVALTVIAELPE